MAGLRGHAAPGSKSTAGSTDTENGRPLWTDARRNRERLLLAVHEDFSVRGDVAWVPRSWFA